MLATDLRDGLGPKDRIGMRLEAPLEADLVDELFQFWVAMFGGPIDVTPEDILRHDSARGMTVYLRRLSGKLSGACLLATSKGLPSLGGLGEVATSPEFRRRGIATELCRQAVDDFRQRGGQALFLGTRSPDAARVYYRLGWRKLASANVMANISDDRSPEEFLVNHFADLGPATVRAATPADRVPMIPLLTSPHDWQVLDANTAMFSTRYSVLDSCMGLYKSYSAVAKDGQGAWFSAVTEDGHVIVLSTARLDGEGGCQVDGFTHKAHVRSWGELNQATNDWGAGRGASSFSAAVSVEDEEKQSLFESLGFRNTGPGESFDLGGRHVATVRLERG